MSTRRVVALVIGCLLILPALGMLLSGGALTIAVAVQRDDDGYFEVTIDQLQTPTVAVTGERVDFTAGPGSPDWLIDAIDLDLRLRATAFDGDEPIFVGIARQRDLDAYLGGVAHDRVVRIDEGAAVYRRIVGDEEVAAPTDQDIWVASASGPGAQELEWEATAGRWAAVLMNADGSAGVTATLEVGARSDLVVPLAITLLVLGAIGTALAVVLIVYGASGARGRPPTTTGSAPGPDTTPSWATPGPAPNVASGAPTGSSFAPPTGPPAGPSP
jgi:hypothetical protein